LRHGRARSDGGEESIQAIQQHHFVGRGIGHQEAVELVHLFFGERERYFDFVWFLFWHDAVTFLPEELLKC
jgi:hypothetical protein